jgi:SAM-dependent methyltransferase
MLATLALDGSGRLLDIGCGPGSIGLMPAPHYAEVVGVDADADMIAEATRLKRPWFTTRHGAIYEPRTAPPASANFARLFSLVLPLDGSAPNRPIGPRHARHRRRRRAPQRHHTVVGTTPKVWLVPSPICRYHTAGERYLGDQRRAGQKTLPAGTPGDEASVYRAAGFLGPERHHPTVDRRQIRRRHRRVDLLALQLSSPPLREALAAFDVELRVMLNEASNGRTFSERMSPVAFDIW